MTVAELQAALARPSAGDRLTATTLVAVPTGKGGTVRVVLDDPGRLAASAGVSREVYALARCIRSEGYGGLAIGKAAAAVAIGQAIRNGARLAKKSIESTLMFSQFPEANGHFGEQSGRYAATTSDPTRWHAQVAQAVLDGGLPDLARGGHKFVDPAVFKSGLQAGRELSPFVDVMTAWIVKEGNVWLGPIPTIDSYHLVVLGRSIIAGEAQRRKNLAELVAVFEAGKRGQHAPEPGDPDAFTPTWLIGLMLALAAGGVYAGHALRWW